MKKLLLTLTLFSCIYAIGQDGYNLPESSYQTIFKKVTQLDSLTAHQFANNIVSVTNSKYTFLGAKKRETSASYYYIESGLTPAEIQAQKENGCSECMRVNFNVFGDRYVFLEVTGTLNNLVPIWKSEFLPSATAELIKDSFKYREVKDRKTGVDVRLTEQSGVWQIYNWSI